MQVVWLEMTKIFFCPADELFHGQISHRRNHHLIGAVIFFDEFKQVFSGKGSHRINISKDVSAKRMSVKNLVFKVIKNKLRRAVVVGVNFINDDFFFFFEFFLWKYRLKGHVSKQLNALFIVRV